MEEKVEQAYLYDFYGELLNEHQRRIYEDFVFHDLSLSEIADCEGISRQGVHDLIKRCNRTLSGYEQKLHLVQRFMGAKANVEKIHQLIGQYKTTRDDSVVDEIEKISNEILEEL
ncbi:MAG: DNA-binding protein [Lachnospiraceae bacterium]|nr:DNA-binding protein [Lachnospiraceae bacterium]MDE7435506.1 DNA-binding protein [Lachnospiraceae bacterium]